MVSTLLFSRRKRRNVSTLELKTGLFKVLKSCFIFGRIRSILLSTIPRWYFISAKKDNEFIRFKWLDEEFNNYFEFKIDTNSVFSEITLFITDFAFAENMKESEMMWNSAINKMLRIIGGKLVHTPS